MNQLLKIGFQIAGHWHLVSNELSLEMIRHGSRKNILYAFVSDGCVKYVGKTIQPLSKRLYGYSKPGTSQSTNIKNNSNIKELLKVGAAVDILALPDNGLLHYGQFHVNLAAGLEDSIIAVLQPDWNRKPQSPQKIEAEDTTQSMQISDVFGIVLHKTYFNSGFFNVPIGHSASLGTDGEQIDIFCGKISEPITGIINRRCNTNNTPRVMGGAALRDWLQSNANMMEEITINVTSPNEIRINSTTG